MKTKDLDFELIVSSLNSKYISKDVDGAKFYYYVDHFKGKATDLVVAIQTSENCLGVFLNDYSVIYDNLKNSKPIFVIIGNNENKGELQDGINSLSDILNKANGLEVMSFGNHRLNISKFYHPNLEDKTSSPLCDNMGAIRHIKAIGDITKDVNKIGIRLPGLNFSFDEMIYSIFATGNHDDFKKQVYENIMDSDNIDNLKIKKKTI